jgi:hypothetical protein
LFIIWNLVAFAHIRCIELFLTHNFYYFPILTKHEKMNTEAMIALFALAAALGLLGVIAVDAFTIQQVDASGCNNGIAFNASKGRCFH